MQTGNGAARNVKDFRGQALSWGLKSGVIELALHREPCNELGSLSLEELEKFVKALEGLQREAHVLIIYSEMKPGFCAGADLRELYQRSQGMEKAGAVKGVREFLERIHRVLNAIDAAPLTTIAAVHGVT
ncbi:MAG: enoyl-CoA hydratase/isomerase family protein, partial [Candidatus Sulfotelmatobacter sp.]